METKTRRPLNLRELTGNVTVILDTSAVLALVTDFSPSGIKHAQGILTAKNCRLTPAVCEEISVCESRTHYPNLKIADEIRSRPYIPAITSIHEKNFKRIETLAYRIGVLKDINDVLFLADVEAVAAAQYIALTQGVSFLLTKDVKQANLSDIASIDLRRDAYQKGTRFPYIITGYFDEANGSFNRFYSSKALQDKIFPNKVHRGNQGRGVVHSR